MLDSCICVAENGVKMMHDVETIGKRQYANILQRYFSKCNCNNKDIQSPIKQNKIPIFQFHTTKKK